MNTTIQSGAIRQLFRSTALAAVLSTAATAQVSRPDYIAQDLGSLSPTANDFSFGFGVNDAGQVTGYSYDAPGSGHNYSSFISNSGSTVQRIYTNNYDSQAWAINKNGHVVGQLATPNGAHA